MNYQKTKHFLKRFATFTSSSSMRAFLTAKLFTLYPINWKKKKKPKNEKNKINKEELQWEESDIFKAESIIREIHLRNENEKNTNIYIDK